MQRKVMTIGVAACVLALVAGLSLAQQAQRGGERPRGQGGEQRVPGGERGPGGFDPAQMRQRMTEQMKQRLGADDQTWKVMEPRLMRVMELNRQTNAGGMGMMGMFGRGRGGPEGGPQGGPQGERRGPFGGEQTALQKAMAQLQTTLENQSASPEELKRQLTTVRQTREKALQELTAAEQSLREILTVRQEAQLVAFGLLR